MKKRKKKVLTLCLLFGFITSVLLSVFAYKEQCSAAISYTNAETFFHNSGTQHMKVKDGTIYFATQGKLAQTYASDYHTYYSSQGFDVTLTGGGTSVTFSVKIGVSLKEIDARADKDGIFHYQLFCITREKLEQLAINADPVNAKKVLNASKIDVYMDTIIVRVYAGMMGTIEEDGRGGLRTYSPNNNYPWIWHLKDKAQLASAKSTYGGHEFKAYINIHDILENYNLDIYYGADGLPTESAKSSTHVEVVPDYYTGNGTLPNGKKVNNILLKYENGKYKPVTNSSRLLNPMTLFLPSTAGMTKVGYHLDEKEWITEGNKTFDAGGTYSSTQIEPAVAYGDQTICLYANWKPNTYTIKYHSNGGSGFMAQITAKYDTAFSLGNNQFSKTGYTFKGWATSEEGAEKGEVVYRNQHPNLINLTTENGGEIDLYAVWTPNVYTVTLDGDGATTPGTDKYYEKYSIGNYETDDCEKEIDKITPPARTGYAFGGYYTAKNGTGTCYIDAEGNITASNTAFSQNTVLYAHWVPNQYLVTFDKQGGRYGSDSVCATYGRYFPVAEAPLRNGFHFRGYYTQMYGGGNRIYNEHMMTKSLFHFAKDIRLYAHWVDETLPEVRLNVSQKEWTNQEVTLTASAWDMGSGLESLAIYRIEENQEICVSMASNLNGARSYEITFENKTEGAVRYKALAKDKSGNISEAYQVVYYDVTAPTAELIDAKIEENTFSFEFDITDAKPGD